MTIDCNISQTVPPNCIPIEPKVINNDHEDNALENPPQLKTRTFSWPIYPPNPQGKFFKDCVESKIINEKGEWIYPIQLDLPPINHDCWNRILKTLSQVITVKSKSLNRLPQKKQALVMNAYYRLNEYCAYYNLVNPITFDKTSYTLFYKFNISAIEILKLVHESFPDYILASELYGGGVPYLLEQKYYEDAIDMLPLKNRPSKSIYNVLSEVPSDYDLRIFINNGTYEFIENIFSSILSIISQKLMYMGSQNPDLLLIIQETAFESNSHITTEDSHFKQFSIGNGADTRFDFTLVSRLAKPQLFHSHGLSIDLSSFLYHDNYPTPFGTVANGWKSIIDKLTQTLTVDDTQYPYHQGWERLISSVCKGSWCPNPELETAFRSNQGIFTMDRLYKGLIHVSSQHTRSSNISKACTLFTAIAHIYEDKTAEECRYLFHDVNPNSKLLDEWVKFSIKSIQNAKLTTHDVIDIIQFGAMLQYMLHNTSSFKCMYYESSERGYISIKLSKNKRMLIPVNLSRAIERVKTLFTENNEDCKRLVELVLKSFLRYYNKSFEMILDQKYKNELSEIADLLGNTNSHYSLFISVLLNIKGYDVYDSINKLTMKLNSILTLPLPRNKKLVLFHEYKNLLKKLNLINIKSRLIKYSEAIKKKPSVKLLALGLLEDLIHNISSHNFNSIYCIWSDLKKVIPTCSHKKMSWEIYQKASRHGQELAVDSLMTILSFSRGLSVRVVKCWEAEITQGLNHYSFERLLKLTQLTFNKCPKKIKSSFFTQEIIILFFEKLFEKRYFKEYINLLTMSSEKRIFFWRSAEIEKKLIDSIHAVTSSDDIQFSRIISLWGKVTRLGLVNKFPKNKMHYQQLVALLIERAYLKKFDDFGDYLLFECANSSLPIFNKILKSRIDLSGPSLQLSEVEKYSSHLTETQIIEYKISALGRTIAEKDMRSALNLSLDLLSSDTFYKKHIDSFSTLLEKLISIVTIHPEEAYEQYVFQLIAHQQLHWYIHQGEINKHMLSYTLQTNVESIAIKLYELLINRIETLGYHEQFFITEHMVGFLQNLNYQSFKNFDSKQSFVKSLTQKTSLILSTLLRGGVNHHVLLFYNNVIRLRINPYFEVNHYDQIFQYFITLHKNPEYSEVCLETCKNFKEQLCFPAFRESENYLTIIDKMFDICMKHRVPREIAALSKKCYQLLGYLRATPEFKTLVSILKKYQLAVIRSDYKSFGKCLLSMMENSRHITEEEFIYQLEISYQYLNIIDNYNDKISLLIKLQSLKESNEKCFQFIKDVASNLTKFSNEELIVCSEYILRDDAQLWCLYFEYIPKGTSKQNLNITLNQFFTSIINGKLKGSQNQLEECIRFLFSITTEAPSPFVNLLTEKPQNFSKLIFSCSENFLPEAKAGLTNTIQSYLQKSDPNSKDLYKVLHARNNELSKFLKDDQSDSLTELDHQLIVWSCDKLNSQVYSELCIFFTEIHDRSSLNEIAPDRLLGFFFSIPYLEELPDKNRNAVLEFTSILLTLLAPKYTENIDLQLKLCAKIVDIHSPSLYSHATSITLNILNRTKGGHPSLKNVLITIFRESVTKSTTDCFEHCLQKKKFSEKERQEFIFERICALIKNALVSGDIVKQKQVLEESMTLLSELTPSESQTRQAIYHIWDLAIQVFAKDAEFHYTLNEIHQKVCFLTIGKLFKTAVEKLFVKQLWKYSQSSKNQKSLAISIFFDITLAFQNKLLEYPAPTLPMQQSVIPFVLHTIDQFINCSPEQKEKYFPAFDHYINYSLNITEESLFDFSVRSLQNLYRRAVMTEFFDLKDSTLLRCIYFSELKDFISSPSSVKARQQVAGEIIHYIAQHPNHVSLRHGFTLLSSLSRILYSQNPERLANLYHKLLSQLPNFLYEDVHYIFYNKKDAPNAEQRLEKIKQIVGSSPDIKVVKSQLKSIGAKISMIPLFESVRQQIMPGDEVLFSQWNKHDKQYGIELIDHFFQILVQGFDQHPVPETKLFDKYNTIWYLCDMLIKGWEFHGFETNPTTYFEYALKLIPYMQKLLNHPRLGNHKKLHKTFEKLILQKTSDARAKKQQALVIESWADTLLQSNSTKEVSRGKILKELIPNIFQN